MLKRLTKLPPSSVDRSAPAWLMSTPSERTLSRSNTTSVCGWSNLRSVSTYMNLPLAYALPDELVRDRRAAARARRRGDHHVHGEAAAARQRRRRRARSRGCPGSARSRGHLHLQLGACFFRSVHGFVTMPPKPPLGVVIWKMFLVSGSGERLVDAVREHLRLVERGVRRRLDDAEDDALVLAGRQLAAARTCRTARSAAARCTHSTSTTAVRSGARAAHVVCADRLELAVDQPAKPFSLSPARSSASPSSATA
jgi:hypothetical protein